MNDEEEKKGEEGEEAKQHTTEEKKDSDKAASPPPSSSTNVPTSSGNAPTHHLHIDPDEVRSIMAPAAPVAPLPVNEDEPENEELMVSSDNDAVGVVPDKTALYEAMDQKGCALM